ncbi:MAG: DUF4879 domain-containing protein [Thermoanaerobaculia bacterium]
MRWKRFAMRSCLPGLAALAVLAWIGACRNAEAQSAPPLTSVRIVGVRSGKMPRGEWWPKTEHPTVTAQDHGGSFVEVDVLETGYARTRLAFLNGRPAASVRMQAVLSTGRRKDVTGYLVTWKVSNVEGGQFFCESVGAGKVGEKLSDAMNIR